MQWPLVAVCLLSGFVNFWELSRNGWANAFYSAAAQAGAESWEAWLFGSSDPLNAISVDKIPAALWIDSLSVRIFGLNTWAICGPQAVMGVACVALIYVLVARVSGTVGAVAAGMFLALTPVAVQMFRFNNPDVLMILLMLLSVWGLVRALETGSWVPLAFAGACTGGAFLAKMLQGIVLTPILFAVFLLASSLPTKQRLRHLAGAAISCAVAGLWYVALVELTPAGHRPFVSSTLHNSIVELLLGYNGFGRLTGQEIPAWLVGRSGLGAVTDEPSAGRLFGGEIVSQASWLLIPAVVCAVGLLLHDRWRPRTDLMRAQVLVWFGWLTVVGYMFSTMKGILHAYYLVALAPPLAALVGMGIGAVWQRRSSVVVTGFAIITVLTGAATSIHILRRAHGFHPWLRPFVVSAAVVAVVALLARWHSRSRSVATVVACAAATLSLLAGPAAFSAYTMKRPIQGATPVAGPTLMGETNRRLAFERPHLRGFSGPLEAASVSPALAQIIRAESARWPVATVGATAAALLQLGTDRPILAIGGYNGLDPFPTVEAFRGMAERHEVRYLYDSPDATHVTRKAPRSQAYAIYQWASSHCARVTLDGTGFFDLSRCER